MDIRSLRAQYDFQSARPNGRQDYFFKKTSLYYFTKSHMVHTDHI